MFYAHLTFRKLQSLAYLLSHLNACFTKYFKIGIYALFCIVVFSLANSIHASVVINEVLPNPKGSDKENEWVELYNTSVSSVSINGYVLEDNKERRIFLSGEISDWLVVHPKDFPQDGSFALTNSGSTLKLFESSTSADPIDTFSYSGSSEDKSWGRIPDGGAVYSEKLIPTKLGSNQIPETPSPKPTLSPSPTADPTPTKKPTSKPTILAAVSPTSTPKQVIQKLDKDATSSSFSASDILATSTSTIKDDQRSSPEVLGEKKKRKNPFFLFFITGGSSFLAAAVFLARQIKQS